jgi:CheY-like chemotaxis protein
VKPKVLFADDDLLMRQLYRPHLERAGYVVVEAVDGAEAYQVTLRERPNVVVMDMLMPRTDGIASIVRIKEAESTRSIPVIAISGEVKYHCLRKALRDLGIESFLSKPFSPAKLILEIHGVHQRNARG